MSSKHAWKVELIPWDYTSEEHVTRMYDQRVAYGWRAVEVPSWAESAKKGGRITQRHDGPSHALSVLEYVDESSPLRDTAPEIRLVQRKPSNKRFIPIGHVALDVHSPEEDAKFGLPPREVVWVHSLYISYQLHNGGFGAATMDSLEALAAKEPINAKYIVLDTLSKDAKIPDDVLKALYADRGLPERKVSNEDWYTRRGYKRFHVEEKAAVHIHEDGHTTNLDLAYLSKRID
ncbi:uncharacterized protein BCR38DRAFT_345318 [Pseudomassariella vexata]|uniref:N-acetyltransferase domain-containing protein n=1 Tax=Pseudomassariella vexata TaxID=1141098 RepID=A0A1Y2DUQ1_9PEZI|nr:uncharacterized protein BCR38DRAFT_345318 [Pseudomassariella vexata]ORY62967.1 hypothetical protein BCR38DRAFT_345318 [Pseudomassariella vexata]